MLAVGYEQDGSQQVFRSVMPTAPAKGVYPIFAGRPFTDTMERSARPGRQRRHGKAKRTRTPGQPPQSQGTKGETSSGPGSQSRTGRREPGRGRESAIPVGAFRRRSMGTQPPKRWTPGRPPQSQRAQEKRRPRAPETAGRAAGQRDPAEWQRANYIGGRSNR